jgi:hypothetical protein
VAGFPRTVADAVAATPLSDRMTDADRRVVTVAVDTVSDALARLRELYLDRGFGLRGGRFRVDGDDGTLSLSGVRWTTDAAVSGTVAADADGGLGEGAEFSVGVRTDDGTAATLSWRLGELGDAVVVTGEIDGREVRAQARYA